MLRLELEQLNSSGELFMRLFLSNILIIGFLLSHSYVVAGQSLYYCDKAQLIVANFVNSKQAPDWSVLEDYADKYENCKCEMAPVFYYIYRMKVVLPNTQILRGISSNEFTARQKVKMMNQIKILKRCEKSSYLPLVVSMIKQNFDIEIAASAEILKKKLGT